ncbi:small nuclear ribonucleoprotein (snRNP)-like protein [Pullulanibacillus pueri]|uniref:Uncharacterized protein n=1 Tax=Pullulanibacillus pueri TaxID=1437324 RepID=A0A8J2ZV12_9BACL|nr:hypothetical protein [Pullulanibacillus pueri]MBM7681513.1 small nuclear ribonucleoprotein (snRNP)-like protein [Pullulanibacillus pueri]GGH79180.1 hypothetical protein GCM10007096_13730 [Pullulanibacillus pueri]
MSREHCYKLLSQAIGEAVKLETSDGALYKGIVVQLDANYLYLYGIDENEKQQGMVQITPDNVDVIPLASIVMLDILSIF